MPSQTPLGCTIPLYLSVLSSFLYLSTCLILMLFLTKGDKLNKVAMHPCVDNFKFSWLMTVPLLDWGTKFVGYYPTIIAVLEMAGFEPALHLLKYPQLSFQSTQHHIPKLPNSYHRWHSISTKYNWTWTNSFPCWDVLSILK